MKTIPKDKILIIDEHPITRQGLKALFAEDPGFEVCGEAATTKEALRKVDELKRRVVIVDVTVDNGTGLDLIDRLARHSAQVCVLVFSARDDNIFAERVLRAGAPGYVNKEADRDTLVKAVRCVVDGEVYLNPIISQRLVRGAVKSMDSENKPAVTLLSNRELEIYEMVGRGLGTVRIAKLLHLSPKTIETYYANIKNKLHFQDMTELRYRVIVWVLEQLGGTTKEKATSV